MEKQKALQTGSGKWSQFATKPQKSKAKVAARGKVAVIYTRVSTKEQAETNQSLETQLTRCNTYADKNGYEVVGYFGGTYESAKNDERKEFQRMLDFVKKSKHQIGFIIVYSHDRFSRSGSGAIGITDQLNRLGISVVAVTQPMDTMTASGKLQQGIQFLFSQFDNDQRREKCITGMEAKIRKGYWVSKAPMGYDQAKINGEQKIVPNKDAKFIRLAFKLKAEQGLTNTEIIAALRKQGFKIYNQTLTKIFKNPFYCGLISHGLLEEGEIVEGKHQALVTKETFLRVNNLQAENYHGYTQVKQDDDLPLRHHIRCGSCSTPLTGYLVKQKGLYYYKCNKIGCKLNRSTKKLHYLYQELLKDYQVDAKKIPQIKLALEQVFDLLSEQKAGDAKQIKTQLTEIQKKLSALERRHVFGEIDASLYRKYSEELKKEEMEIAQNLDNLAKPLSNHKKVVENGLKLMVNLSQSWSKGKGPQRRQLQALVFPEGVQFDREIEGYRTARVNSFFALSRLISQKMEEKKKGKNDQFDHFSPLVARRGIKLLTIYNYL